MSVFSIEVPTKVVSLKSILNGLQLELETVATTPPIPQILPVGQRYSFTLLIPPDTTTPAPVKPGDDFPLTLGMNLPDTFIARISEVFNP